MSSIHDDGNHIMVCEFLGVYLVSSEEYGKQIASILGTAEGLLCYVVEAHDTQLRNSQNLTWWKQHLQTIDVLILTAEIAVNFFIPQQLFSSPNNIDLIVYDLDIAMIHDLCFETFLKFYYSMEHRPSVLAVTSSPIDTSTCDVRDKLESLALRLDCFTLRAHATPPPTFPLFIEHLCTPEPDEYDNQPIEFQDLHHSIYGALIDANRNLQAAVDNVKHLPIKHFKEQTDPGLRTVQQKAMKVLICDVAHLATAELGLLLGKFVWEAAKHAFRLIDREHVKITNHRPFQGEPQPKKERCPNILDHMQNHRADPPLNQTNVQPCPTSKPLPSSSSQQPPVQQTSQEQLEDPRFAFMLSRKLNYFQKFNASNEKNQKQQLPSDVTGILGEEHESEAEEDYICVGKPENEPIKSHYQIHTSGKCLENYNQMCAYSTFLEDPKLLCDISSTHSYLWHHQPDFDFNIKQLLDTDRELSRKPNFRGLMSSRLMCLLEILTSLSQHDIRVRIVTMHPLLIYPLYLLLCKLSKNFQFHPILYIPPRRSLDNKFDFTNAHCAMHQKFQRSVADAQLDMIQRSWQLQSCIIVTSDYDLPSLPQADVTINLANVETIDVYSSIISHCQVYSGLVLHISQREAQHSLNCARRSYFHLRHYFAVFSRQSEQQPAIENEINKSVESAGPTSRIAPFASTLSQLSTSTVTHVSKNKQVPCSTEIHNNLAQIASNKTAGSVQIDDVSLMNSLVENEQAISIDDQDFSSQEKLQQLCIEYTAPNVNWKHVMSPLYSITKSTHSSFVSRVFLPLYLAKYDAIDIGETSLLSMEAAAHCCVKELTAHKFFDDLGNPLIPSCPRCPATKTNVTLFESSNESIVTGVPTISCNNTVCPSSYLSLQNKTLSQVINKSNSNNGNKHEMSTTDCRSHNAEQSMQFQRGTPECFKYTGSTNSIHLPHQESMPILMHLYCFKTLPVNAFSKSRVVFSTTYYGSLPSEESGCHTSQNNRNLQNINVSDLTCGLLIPQKWHSRPEIKFYLNAGLYASVIYRREVSISTNQFKMLIECHQKCMEAVNLQTKNAVPDADNPPCYIYCPVSPSEEGLFDISWSSVYTIASIHSANHRTVYDVACCIDLRSPITHLVALKEKPSTTFIILGLSKTSVTPESNDFVVHAIRACDFGAYRELSPIFTLQATELKCLSIPIDACIFPIFASTFEQVLLLDEGVRVLMQHSPINFKGCPSPFECTSEPVNPIGSMLCSVKLGCFGCEHLAHLGHVYIEFAATVHIMHKYPAQSAPTLRKNVAWLCSDDYLAEKASDLNIPLTKSVSIASYI